MFEILSQSTDKTLVAHMGGEITSEEYQQFTDEVEKRLKAGGEVSLVLDLKGVEFYKDFDAMKKDFEFGKGDYKKLHRVALVSEEKWMERVTRLFGVFSPVHQKHFAEGKLDEAIAWASA